MRFTRLMRTIQRYLALPLSAIIIAIVPITSQYCSTGWADTSTGWYGPCVETQATSVIVENGPTCSDSGCTWTATCAGVKIYNNYQASCTNQNETTCYPSPNPPTATYYPTVSYLGNTAFYSCVGFSTACGVCLSSSTIAWARCAGPVGVVAAVTDAGCAAVCLVGGYLGVTPCGCCFNCCLFTRVVYTGSGTTCHD